MMLKIFYESQIFVPFKRNNNNYLDIFLFGNTEYIRSNPVATVVPLNWPALLSSADKHCVCPVLYYTVLCLPSTLLLPLSSMDALCLGHI